MRDLGTGLLDPSEGEQARAERAQHNRAVAEDIRAGLDAAEFEPFFQPIVSLADGTVTGFEALARWRNPERGLLPPVEFVGPAEATGLIREIDAAIFERAWRELDEALVACPQPDSPPLLSVNLSAEHFLDTAIVDRIGALIGQGYGKLSRLQMEITETLLINNTEKAERILGELKALGVAIALDDFGTGYSSLVYLHRFPIDCIKIDRSFSESMVRSDRSHAIVRSIVSLAQSMGLRTVAEGVEDKAVADALIALGCQYGQGTHFSPPVPQAGLATLLKPGLRIPA